MVTLVSRNRQRHELKAQIQQRDIEQLDTDSGARLI